MPRVLPGFYQVPHAHVTDRFSRDRGIVSDEPDKRMLDNDAEDRWQAASVTWDMHSQASAGFFVLNQPSLAIPTSEIMHAVRAAVNKAVNGLMYVRDGHGENGDVGDLFEFGVVHGPGEVLVQIAADEFLGGNACDEGVAGADPNVEEIAECFQGWRRQVLGGGMEGARERTYHGIRELWCV